MKRTYLTCIIMLAMAVYNNSCSKSNDNNGTSIDCSSISNKAFAADVNPIIQSTCNVVSCHNTGSSNGVGAITNYTEAFTNRAKIRTAIANGSMPQGTSLTTAQRNSIICWVDSGAPNN
jgi:hypothetical protein